MQVILDTNVLMLPGTLGFDVFAETERLSGPATFCVIDKSIDELNKLALHSKKGKDKNAARLALQLIEKKGIIIIPTSGSSYADEHLLNMEGYAIATIDKALLAALKQRGRQAITLRQKKYMVFY